MVRPRAGPERDARGGPVTSVAGAVLDLLLPTACAACGAATADAAVICGVCWTR
ncbi:MAG: double zinc ribbon domain-containing protein, partial [Gemmatimonadota bacterium]|nr:double zinc ribbon domain-containing protein [Gemmatimonadota bacterium]